MECDDFLVKEQRVLELYFSNIGHFNYDKAKEIVEKERDGLCKTGANYLFSSVLTALSQMALAEKLYMSLQYLAPKSFLRKDCRYDKLYSLSAGKMMKFKDLSGTLSDIIHENQRLFHHPILTPLKSSFTTELETLQHLMEAQVLLSQWQFLQALLHLKEAHARLGEWNASLQPPEGRRSTPSLLRADRLPHLFTWITKLNAFMVGKFTLYFYKILSRQSTPQEMKNFGSKMTIDYCQRIASLCKKSDALCVQLLFEALGVEGYYEHGYRHPDHIVEPPKGIDSYPVIYSYPPTYQDKQHRPNIIMIITKKCDDLNSEGIVYFYDSRMEKSYFLVKLDPRVTMVAIYASRKSERDTYIVSFMQDIAANIRGNKVFGMLKPGNK